MSGARVTNIDGTKGARPERPIRARGKVRYVGVSNFSVPQLERVRPRAEIASLQPPYSALMRQIEDEILPFCLDNEIGVVEVVVAPRSSLRGKTIRELEAELLPDREDLEQAILSLV